MENIPISAGTEIRQTGGVIERVIRTLSVGPLHTTELATRVLDLRSGASAAATVIFSLLGPDPRFVVDGAGVWSLATPLARVAPRSLIEGDWAVVDVETTGGSPHRGHRVTEVAVVCVSNGGIRESFSSLVHPGRRIPALITSLTGISDAMVRDAPRFEEVASRVTEILRGRVFVAHNAAFDWGFLSSELERAVGGSLDGPRLCTVRLARKLLPQLPSRSLDALAVYFGLDIAARHRALDDAVATAHVLINFFDLLEDQGITSWDGLQHLLSRRASRRKRRASPTSVDSA